MSYRRTIPDEVRVCWGDRALDLVPYGWDADGTYFKARAPEGGTIEVHVLNRSYFDDHPCARPGETPEDHAEHARG